MIALTVIERELRVATRQKWAWVGRWFPAALAILMFGGVYLLYPARSSGDFGKVLFHSLGFVMVLVAGLGGMLTTCDCLSREHREGTLGLLFLTELSALDVLAGKILASSLRLLLGLLAVVPVLAISFLAGGTSLRSLAMLVVAILSLLWVSMAAGVFASARYRTAGQSLAGAMLVMLILCGGLPALAFINETFWSLQWMSNLCWLAWPFSAYDVAVDQRPMADFFKTLGMVQLISWSLLLLAGLRLSGSWRVFGDGSGVRFRAFRFWGAGPAARERLKRRLLDDTPYAWRCCLPAGRGRWVWLLIGLNWFIYVLGCWIRPRWFFTPESVLFVTFSTHLVIKVLVTLETPRVFISDRFSGAMELLRVSLLSPRDLVWGQCKALVLLFGWPVVMAVLVDIALLIMGPWSGQDGGVARWMLFGGLVVFVADVPVLALFCLAQASRLRSETHSITFGFACVMVLPWLLFFGAILALTRFPNVVGVRQFPILWVGICLLVDFVLWAWSRARLEQPVGVLSDPPSDASARSS